MGGKGRDRIGLHMKTGQTSIAFQVSNRLMNVQVCTVSPYENIFVVRVMVRKTRALRTYSGEGCEPKEVRAWPELRGSVAKITGCSCKGLQCDTQHPHGRSQSSVSEEPMPSSGLCEPCAQTFMQAKPIHIK